jgi:endonuclease/exonuclease/phosphatase family metal-dependent hydrolase
VDTLRLGAWNLRKYGFDGQKDNATLADIIKAHFDLIALLEVVFSPDERALSDLARTLGPEFALSVTSTPRPNLNSPYSEYYVIAYRRALVAPCAELPELTFFPDGDGSAESATRGLFLREPAFACYRALDRPHGYDFLLAAYHAQFGDGQAQEIADEVRHIDSVFAVMQQKLPEERALYMIGDFNLVPDALQPLTRARDRTAGNGSTLDAQSNISTHLYDHLLAYGSAANAALLADASVLDVRGEAFDLKDFRAQLSDHLPIMAQLRLSEDDD